MKVQSVRLLHDLVYFRPQEKLKSSALLYKKETLSFRQFAAQP
tara:strand:- start:30772 stop:30900 length:129 start_codon:yes stop_codon:yes gene_type:complete